MFFYRYRVVESHLNKYAWWLYQKFILNKSEKIATAGSVLHIHKIYDNNSREWVYFVVDTSISTEVCPKKPSHIPHPALLGFASMVKPPRWIALETAMLYVSPESRGKGIATILYDSILKDGKIIMSGYSHNQKSRRLWMNIVQNPKYTVWAHDIVDLNRYADVQVVDGTFACELKIYEDIKKMRRRRRQDVRFIAFNKRYLQNESITCS